MAEMNVNRKNKGNYKKYKRNPYHLSLQPPTRKIITIPNKIHKKKK